MTYKPAGIYDNRESGETKIVLRVRDCDEHRDEYTLHEIVFHQFDTDEFVPYDIRRVDDRYVDVGFVFNGGLEFACEYVALQCNVTVPFNQPGFGEYK